MLSELSEIVVRKLKQKNLKLATAESCTGGMLAQYITSINGSSEVFEMGIVSYGNWVKEQELDVNSNSISSYGAVSEQVCREMAFGVLKKANSEISASITGIAGPSGGTAEKPVGTVYIAVATKQAIVCKHLNLSGDRRNIREQTVKQTLSLIKEVIDTL